MPKNALYLEGLPLFMRRLVSISDDGKLIKELRLLERRVKRSGKDSVDHGPSGSDDLATFYLARCILRAMMRGGILCAVYCERWAEGLAR